MFFGAVFVLEIWANRGSRADNRLPSDIATFRTRTHTQIMGVLFRRGVLVLAITMATLPACGDEIRLKDGKKLYGVIVAYEENMFKVKTEFGYVLVEKDKIASIVPTTPAPNPETKPDVKAGDASKSADKGQPNAQPRSEPAVASGSEPNPAATTASAKTPVPGAGKHDIPAKVNGSATLAATQPGAAKTSAQSTPTASGTATTPAPAAQPKQPEVPAIREDVQGNLYTNYTNGFRMYKAPSWELIADARNALPNAIVAMGTADESTLLVVGREQTKQALEAAANSVEKRLRDVYENYRQVSQRKTTLGGSPAVEFRYIGKADEHDWSGTLVVIARGGDIFTVLGMTYADSDLIQIQENVIAKAVASMNFDVH